MKRTIKISKLFIATAITSVLMVALFVLAPFAGASASAAEGDKYTIIYETFIPEYIKVDEKTDVSWDSRWK